MRVLLTVAGAIMIVAVLGMVGYGVTKGPVAKGLKLADASTSKVATGQGGAASGVTVTAVVQAAKKKEKPAPAKRRKRKAKHAAKKKEAFKNETPVFAAPGRLRSKPSRPVVTLAAAVEDDGAIYSSQKDRRSEKLLFRTEPHCSLGQDIHRCAQGEQGRMVRSYFCMDRSSGNTCLEWQPQRQCLAAETNRFTSSHECERACKEAGRCGKAEICDCTGLFRKVNYVFDSVRKRCRLIPKIECVNKNVGFSDYKSCKDACAQAASRRRHVRCGLGSLESVVRPCRWDDKLYTHYFDHTSKRCEPWDKSACMSDAFPRLAECLRACVGPRSKYKQQRHVAQH